MINERLARSGKPFFRVRKYASTVVIIGGGIIAINYGHPIFDDPSTQLYYDVFWVGVAALGGLFRILASGFAAPGTSGEGKKEAEASTLNTTGAYSIVRNPLYVGRILTFTGIAFFSGAWQYGLFVFLASIHFFRCVIAYEEQFLAGKFGEAYKEWYQRVPSLFPKFSLWVWPERKWWWRRLFFRETFKVLDLVTTIAVYTVLKNYAVTGVLHFSESQEILLIVIPVIYVVMKLLRRYTNAFAGIQ